MLMPSTVELGGIILAVTLLAADWYIWDPRYRIFRSSGPDLTPRLVREGKNKIHLRGGHRWSTDTIFRSATSARKHPGRAVSAADRQAG